MNDSRDRVESALEALRRERFPGDRLSPEREASLLLRARAGRPRGRIRRGLLAAAVLLLCCGGFAAAGGIEIVREWLISVKILHRDGKVTDGDVRDARENEDGTRDLRVGIGEGAEAEVHITPPEESLDGQRRLDVQLDGDRPPDGAVILIKEREKPDPPAKGGQ